MKLNADFSVRAVVHAAQQDWLPSPTAGVERRLLDRLGGEVARATSIVRYAPNSRFPSHFHPGGEEILVLDGVFEDEGGQYPPGFYLRNPPGSKHAPGSTEGCTIFVKLWQFDPEDRQTVRLNTKELTHDPAMPRIEDGRILLYQDARETVCMEEWGPHATVNLEAPGGLEVLVVQGGYEALSDSFGPQSWLRLPPGDRLTVRAGRAGTRIWSKSGHLSRPLGLHPNRNG